MEYNEEVLRKHGLMAPRILLLQAKLLTLMRLIQRAPAALLVVVAAAAGGPRAWITSALADCRLLADHAPELSEMRGRSDADWISFIRQTGKSFPKVVAKACAHPWVNAVTIWATSRPQREFDATF
eukprot:5884498-Karenia_brevis.AAC.1